MMAIQAFSQSFSTSASVLLTPFLQFRTTERLTFQMKWFRNELFLDPRRLGKDRKRVGKLGYMWPLKTTQISNSQRETRTKMMGNKMRVKEEERGKR